MINWTAIAAVIGSIATVAGSYGGYMLAGRNEEARDKRADQREARARRAALTELRARAVCRAAAARRGRNQSGGD